MQELLSVLMLMVLIPAILVLIEIIWERIEDAKIAKIEREDEGM